MAHFVVIGAGQAGASLVAKLRNLGFEGKISLIGAEDAPPYQRPPLSKKYLLGDMPLDRMYLRPVSFYENQDIDLRLGQPVTAIDAEKRLITVGSEEIPYDKLALTTGSTPIRLPAKIGGDLDGVHTVRTLADVDGMKAAFDAGGHMLIVGGGYIGLEAAAVAAQRGLKVTLVELADRILQRVASPATSDYFRDLHTGHGVTILEGTGLERLNGDGAVSQAVLSDGSVLDIDVAVVGVGIRPDVVLAGMAGLAQDNGIATDSGAQTSDPNIWAAGDCASFPYQDTRIRLESVPNAIDQAEIAAANMMGGGAEYVAKPWFWSDQYDVKLQIAGLNTGYDQVVVRDGGASRSHWYYKDGALLAVDAMNDPRAYMIGKRVIEAGKSIPPAAAGDADADLKQYMK